MTNCEKYRDVMNEQVIRMLEGNLKWLKNLEQPRQKETVDCGCKYQDKQKGI